MIIFHAVGDIWIKDGIPGPEPPRFREVIDAFADADIRFGNLEAPLSTRGFPTEKWSCLRSNPSVAVDLEWMGFDALSVATNHMMDYGGEALLDTLTALDRSGIRYVGGGRNLDEAMKCALLGLKGKSVGFLAFSSLLPSGAAGYDRPGLAPARVSTAVVIDPTAMMREEPGHVPRMMNIPVESDLDRLRGAIADAREVTDWLVVSFHWGIGGEERILDYQLELGHAAVDSGADLVIGHHPHTLQGIEIYKGSYIIYSLGNFVFEQPVPPDRADLPLYGGVTVEMSPYSMILRMAMDEKSGFRVHLLPLRLDGNGYPRTTDAEETDLFVQRVSRLCEPFGTEILPEDQWLAVEVGQ